MSGTGVILSWKWKWSIEMDYWYLYVMWSYFAETTLSGNYTNAFLYKLPEAIQECAQTIGQWLAGILF